MATRRLPSARMGASTAAIMVVCLASPAAAFLSPAPGALLNVARSTGPGRCVVVSKKQLGRVGLGARPRTANILNPSGGLGLRMSAETVGGENTLLWCDGLSKSHDG